MAKTNKELAEQMQNDPEGYAADREKQMIKVEIYQQNGENYETPIIQYFYPNQYEGIIRLIPDFKGKVLYDPRTAKAAKDDKNDELLDVARREYAQIFGEPADEKDSVDALNGMIRGARKKSIEGQSTGGVVETDTDQVKDQLKHVPEKGSNTAQSGKEAKK